jgi:mannitol-specific phosphotransferase system IIBC component
MMRALPSAMAAQANHGGTVAGTASGALLTLFANIHSEDVMKTAILSLLGAIVSFGVTLGLRWVARKFR